MYGGMHTGVVKYQTVLMCKWANVMMFEFGICQLENVMMFEFDNGFFEACSYDHEQDRKRNTP